MIKKNNIGKDYIQLNCETMFKMFSQFTKLLNCKLNSEFVN